MGIDGWNNVLANSASTRSRMKPNSISSRALNTSAGMIVFLFALRVNSFALWNGGSAFFCRDERGSEFLAYLFARWLMKTVALLLSARIALACICVLGGSTPLASRVMIDLGRVRSWSESQG